MIDKKSRDPAQWRVLMPWLFGATRWALGGKEDPPLELPIYLFWKWALMSIAMMAASYFLSPIIALGMGLFWVLTFQYDYWCVYSEALAFVLVLTGNPLLGVAGGVIGGLTKNTAVVLPLVFACVNRTWWSILVAAACYGTLAFVRFYQGNAPRYHPYRNPMNCAFFTVWKGVAKRRYLIIGWGVIIVSWIVFAHFQYMPEPYRSTAWVLPAMTFAAMFFALIHEPRVMAVNIIWIVSLLIGE